MKKEQPKYMVSGFTPMQADDAISGLIGAVETLLQLDALFKAIIVDCDRKNLNTEHLAKLGAYMSSDYANILDCGREQLEGGKA